MRTGVSGHLGNEAAGKVASLPADSEISPEWGAFIASLGRSAAQLRIKQLLERGFHRPGDVETRLGYHVGRLGSDAT